MGKKHKLVTKFQPTLDFELRRNFWTLLSPAVKESILSDEVSQSMAKEKFNRGDGVVEKNPDHRRRVWTVYKVSKQYVNVRYKVNGEFVRTRFSKKELRLLYKQGKQGQQMLFFFY